MTVMLAARRDGRWVAEPGFGVYVHIPFCRHRCHYCDFNTYEGQEELHESYIDALVADIERLETSVPPATSVFFGGGTPTLVPGAELGRVVDAIRTRIGIDDGAEVTVEANPETVDERAFAALRDAGFNRVSIGVQSLVPRVLLSLGRTHSPERALDALAAAHAAGFEDVNADLIYGSPWETPGDWEGSLQGIIDAGPEHVSAYALTVEEQTPLATLVDTGRMPDVDPDVQADRHERASEELAAAGYERYEVSNWARPGHASRHNVLYWCAGEYLGFGAGAHGYTAGERYWSVRLPRDYIAAVRGGFSTVEGRERLTADEVAGEALMLGLRLASGIDVAGFTRRFGPGPLARRAEVIDELVMKGLVERTSSALRVPERAVMVANEVESALL